VGRVVSPFLQLLILILICASPSIALVFVEIESPGVEFDREDYRPRDRMFLHPDGAAGRRNV